MKCLYSIKATARNKDRARVWVERSDLGTYGFARGVRIDIAIGSDSIVITANPEGKRKVAGRVKPSGDEIQILDICMPLPQRELIRGDSERFNVFVEQGRIVITTGGEI